MSCTRHATFNAAAKSRKIVISLSPVCFLNSSLSLNVKTNDCPMFITSIECVKRECILSSVVKGNTCVLSCKRRHAELNITRPKSDSMSVRKSLLSLRFSGVIPLLRNLSEDKYCIQSIILIFLISHAILSKKFHLYDPNTPPNSLFLKIASHNSSKTLYLSNLTLQKRHLHPVPLPGVSSPYPTEEPLYQHNE